MNRVIAPFDVLRNINQKN